MNVKNLLIGVLSITAAGSLAGNVFLYQRYSSNRPLLRMNGSDVITRKDYQDRLDFAVGKPTLNKMVFDHLVLKAAEKAGLTPTDKDVDGRIADIQRTNPNALAASRADARAASEFKQNLKVRMALERLRVQGVTATDAEVRAAYAKNRAALALPRQTTTSAVLTKHKVDADTAAELLRQKSPLDVIARQPRLYVVGLEINPDLRLLPRDQMATFQKTLASLKEGQVATVPAGADFLTFRVDNIAPAGVPAFEQVKGKVAMAVKMQKAPSDAVVIARLFKEANVQFEISKYAGYFDEVKKFDEASQGNQGKKDGAATSEPTKQVAGAATTGNGKG